MKFSLISRRRPSFAPASCKLRWDQLRRLRPAHADDDLVGEAAALTTAAIGRTRRARLRRERREGDERDEQLPGGHRLQVFVWTGQDRLRPEPTPSRRQDWRIRRALFCVVQFWCVREQLVSATR